MNMQFKIAHIIGARPHFMKLAPIFHLAKSKKQFKQVIIHTGQHYDPELSDRFLTEFFLPKPKYNLEVGSQSQVPQIGNVLIKLDEVLDKVKPDIVFVYGDTNSTVAGAIAAAKKNIPLAHIEAGLREFDKSIPEEVNKLLIDSVSDLLFCPTQTAVDNLNTSPSIGMVHLVGDVVVDLILQGRKMKGTALKKYNLSPEEYYFATCHRAFNTDDKDNLKEILTSFFTLDKPVIFPIHHRTRAAVNKFNLEGLLRSKNIICIDPVGFWETQELIANAKCTITDSGGIIRESNVHQTPCVIIDYQTEWVESVDAGWAVIAGPEMPQINDAVKNFVIPSEHSSVFGDGTASERILELTECFLKMWNED